MKEREKEYIITLILNQGFVSGGQDKVASYLEDLFKKYRGKIEGLRFLGDRKFAYPIKRQQVGFYVFVLCKMISSQVRFFRRDMELTGDIILRFLILRKEEAQKLLNITDLAEYKLKKEESSYGVITQ